jgi:hypothetical protein
MKHLIIIIFSLSIFGNACKKAEKTEATDDTYQFAAIKSVDNYTTIDPLFIYNYISNQSICYLDLNSFTGVLNEDNRQRQFYGFTKNNLNLSINNLSINNSAVANSTPESVKSDNNALLTGYYGKNLNFKFDIGYPGAINQIAFDLYSPSELKLTPNQNFTSIFPGKKITWNPENSGTCHYLISIDFSPKSFANNHLTNVGSNKITKTILLSNVNEYVFTVDDLIDFPATAVLDVDVFKGNFVMYEDTKSSKKFFAASHSNIIFTTVRN